MRQIFFKTQGVGPVFRSCETAFGARFSHISVPPYTVDLWGGCWLQLRELSKHLLFWIFRLLARMFTIDQFMTKWTTWICISLFCSIFTCWSRRQVFVSFVGILKFVLYFCRPESCHNFRFRQLVAHFWSVYKTVCFKISFKFVAFSSHSQKPIYETGQLQLAISIFGKRQKLLNV